MRRSTQRWKSKIFFSTNCLFFPSFHTFLILKVKDKTIQFKIKKNFDDSNHRQIEINTSINQLILNLDKGEKKLKVKNFILYHSNKSIFIILKVELYDFNTFSWYEKIK